MGVLESIILLGIMAALAAMPSASVALVVSRSVTLGIANGLAVSLGIILGDLVFIVLAILGLSVVAEIMGSLFMMIKVLGGLYLIWLGLSLLRAKQATNIAMNRANHKSLISSVTMGFLLTLGDIKAVVFYASLLPIFIDVSNIDTSGILTVVFITILGVGGVKVIYAIFANNVVVYAQSKSREDKLRKISGSVMVGAGSYLILKA